MGDRTLAVVGATGDVGSGIVRAVLRRGWHVVAVARTAERLADLRAEHGDAVRTLVGSIAEEAAGAQLADALGPVDAVVVAVSAGYPLHPIRDWTAQELNSFVGANIGPHLVAARHLLPIVRRGGDFLGIGGGMADLVLPKYVPLAISEAGRRQLYRGLVREDCGRSGVRIRELLIRAMVDGPSTRDRARPDWITDDEIGEHVADLLDEPVIAGDQSILTLASPRATA
jgi:NAD(P)-dependent dehydrogenase (short-subunit alcohol dehydrogenase family)